MLCQNCQTKIVPQIGEIWHNENNFKVKILDIGESDIWLLYLENNNRIGWNKEKFLSSYHYLSKTGSDEMPDVRR